jgi:signal peptidase I
VNDVTSSGLSFQFQARGRSMLPTIQDGDLLQVTAAAPLALRVGDILVFKDHIGFKAHRIVEKHHDFFITRGDSGLETDGHIRHKQILGKVIAKYMSSTGHRVRLEGRCARGKFVVVACKRKYLGGIPGRIISRLLLPWA